MSDMPERIWVWRNEPGNEVVISVPDQPYPSYSHQYIRKDIAQAQIDAAVKAERERCAVLIAKFDIPEDAAAAGTSFCRDAPSRVFAAAIRKGEQP
jgi:hypothetical protein